MITRMIQLLKQGKQVSSDENPVDIPLYWLVNRDSYIGLL